MKNKPDQEQFISSLYYVEWKTLEEVEKYVKDYLAEERSKVISTIADFAEEERDVLGNFNKLDDEYAEGFWMGMNTVLKFTDKLNQSK